MNEIKFHFENLQDFCDISNSEINALFEQVCADKKSGASGYWDLPFSQSALQAAQNYTRENAQFLQNITDLAIIGVGGSSLGLKAIFCALKHKTKPKLNLHFLECTDCIQAADTFSNLAPKNTLFIMISKSGTTIESTSILKFVLDKFQILKNSESKAHLLVITDENSPLQKWADSENIKFFNIKQNVGGRFSVLSLVGILPLQILGFDCEKILQAARDFSNLFFERKADFVLQKAIFHTKNFTKFPQNILFSYANCFGNFNAWFVQLWAESLGKINSDSQNVGLTPISLIGSIDQHSFLQLIMQGVRDKTADFITIAPQNFENSEFQNFAIPNTQLKFLESTDFANGTSFDKLLQSQALATLDALKEQNVPCTHIEILQLNERAIGALIMHFQILTSATGCAFGINTYDQPGVEFGKQKLKKMFEKDKK